MRVPLGLRLIVLALCVSACGIIGGPKVDETANWSMQKLYSEAKDEMSAGNWTAAVGLLEKLESRYPFGPYAQQAQLDMAYAYYKDGEPEQAINATNINDFSPLPIVLSPRSLTLPCPSVNLEVSIGAFVDPNRD